MHRCVVRTGASEATTWSGEIDGVGATDPLRVVVEELEPGLRDEAGVGVPVETVVYVEALELPKAEAPGSPRGPALSGAEWGACRFRA